MSMLANYWKWYENLLSMSDVMQVTQNLLYSNAKSLKLDTAKTMMSVGAGNELKILTYNDASDYHILGYRLDIDF